MKHANILSNPLNAKIIIIGHRGAAGHAPENTLLSIQKSIDLGADWIEIDVNTVQGEIIVIHDNTLNRTTTGKGRITQKHLSLIRSVNAGCGEKIPFLYEVFDTVNPWTGLHIELKDSHSAIPVGHFISKKIREGWPVENIIVSSFRHDQLRILKNCFPHIQIGVLYQFPKSGYTRIAKKISAVSVHLPWQFTTQRLVREAHEMQLKIFIFIANRKSTIRRMIRLGVDGIFSDYPDRVVEARECLNQGGKFFQS